MVHGFGGGSGCVCKSILEGKKPSSKDLASYVLDEPSVGQRKAASPTTKLCTGALLSFSVPKTSVKNLPWKGLSNHVTLRLTIDQQPYPNNP